MLTSAHRSTRSEQSRSKVTLGVSAKPAKRRVGVALELEPTAEESAAVIEEFVQTLFEQGAAAGVLAESQSEHFWTWN